MDCDADFDGGDFDADLERVASATVGTAALVDTAFDGDFGVDFAPDFDVMDFDADFTPSVCDFLFLPVAFVSASRCDPSTTNGWIAA